MLLNKLLFSISFLLFLSYNSKAQGIIVGDTVSSGVVYKNIKDSSVVILPFSGTKTSDFDLDGDSINDIRFKITRSLHPGGTNIYNWVSSLDSIEFVTLSTSNNYVDTVSLSHTIDVNLHWYNSNNFIYLFRYDYSAGVTSVGGVFSKPMNYLGYRKITQHDTIYGWVYLDAGYSSGIKIRSWAYKCNKIPVLSITSTSTVICALESATISVSGADTYSWSTGNTGPDIVDTPDSTTSYTVSGAYANGCSTSSLISIIVDPCVGIEEYDLNNIKIYPNPVSNILHISNENNLFENSIVEITNYLGQTVLKQSYSKSIDVSLLSKGLYTLKVITQEKEFFYSKFIKE